MSFWTDNEASSDDVVPTGTPGSLEYALTKYAAIPSIALAPVMQMIQDAAPNLPADFDYSQAVQNMVAKQNAQFGGFSSGDFFDGQLPAKLFEQLPGGATAMQNLRQLPAFQNAQALGAERQRAAESAGDSFLGGIARPFLDTGSAINDMRKEGVLNPILAAVGAAYMPQVMSSFGGSGSGAGISGTDFLSNYGSSIGEGGAASSFGSAATGGGNSLANIFSSGDPTANTGLGFKLGSSAATAGLGAGSVSPGIIQQLANFTGLSASAIQSLGGAAISSIASLVGAGMTADAAKKAAQGIADANASSNQLMYSMNAQNQARQQPFYQASLNALPAYTQGVMPGGDLVRPFSETDFKTSPGYGFRLKQGVDAIDRSAAARGNLLSGATLKGVQRYGQDLASNEFQNAYNRYTGDQATRRNALASLTGFGPTASSAIQAGDTAYGSNAANLASNTAATYGNAALTGAAARQSAFSGAGGAFANALNPNSLNAYLNKQYGGM